MLVQHFAGYVEKDVAVLTNPYFDMGIKLSYDFRIYRSIVLQINGGLKNIFNAYQRDFDKGPDRDAGYIYGPSLPRTWFLGAKITF
jgi:outer membrane receptor for ferrienterochelin and colicins